jgi:tetratricopeptide (TPR) repeat protein
VRRLLQRWYWDHMAAFCILFRQREMGIAYYRKMLAADPRDTLAIASIAFRHAEAGRKHDALEMFERVIAIKPDDDEAHFNRGFLLQELGKHDDALAAFQRAIEINPDHDRAHYGIGLSLIHLRRYEEAIAPLKRNTVLQPMSPYGWYQLARVQVDINQRDKAQKVLDHLMTFEPKVAKQLARETGLKLPAQ